MKIFKSKYEKLLERVKEENKHLLTKSILEDVYLLEKFVDWQEEYDYEVLNEFLEYFTKCYKCGCYTEGSCICYAR